MPSFSKTHFFATASSSAVVRVGGPSDTSTSDSPWKDFPPKDLCLKSTKGSNAVKAHKAFRLRWLGCDNQNPSLHLCELSFNWNGYDSLSDGNQQLIAQAFLDEASFTLVVAHPNDSNTEYDLPVQAHHPAV